MRLTLIACGYFKKFVQREIAKASGVSVYKPVLGWKHRRRRNWIYDENRPWTDAAKDVNQFGPPFKELVEPIADSEWKIFKGDVVQILKGIDEGKVGMVCAVIKERNWCYVEGLNCVYKWAGKTATQPGYMSKMEKPLLVTTEVTLLDPSDMKPSPVEWRYDDDGNRVRVAMRTGRILPVSVKAQPDSEDFIDVTSYKTQNCDTDEKELLKVTFKPSLKSFEEEIMDSMGIKEHRKRAPNFYY